MKHLKHYTLLENKNEFYEEVDQSTFIDSSILDDAARIRFDDKLYKKILSLFTKDLMDWIPISNNGIYKRPLLQKDVSLSLSKYCISVTNLYNGIDIIITDDEWYYVMLRGEVIGYETKYYKCDQYEGFVKLLKDFKLI
jgi:hypothetical protein